MNLEENCFEHDLQIRFFFVFILFLLSTLDKGRLKAGLIQFCFLYSPSYLEKREKSYQYSKQKYEINEVVKQSIDSERSTSHIRHDTDVGHDFVSLLDNYII